MTVTQIPTSEAAIAQAVAQVRKHRHQPDCRCGLYRDRDHAPFCSNGESEWSAILDRLISRALTPDQP